MQIREEADTIKSEYRFMRGQMLLIVVLVMVVILTVGLSAASRTITSIRVSTDEEDSERAFSAAEAGLEVALSQNNNLVSGTLDNASSYRTTINNLSGVEFLLNNSLAILKDDSADVWLSRYPDYAQQYTGNMTVYWGSSVDLCDRSELVNTMAALDIVLISGNRNNPIIRHISVDPCASRRSDNQFGATSSGGNVNGRSFAYSTTVPVVNGLIARIIPLYASTIIGVRGCNAGGGGCQALPAQGTVIESIGTSENAQRKIISYRAYPKLPTELFPFVIFVPN